MPTRSPVTAALRSALIPMPSRRPALRTPAVRPYAVGNSTTWELAKVAFDFVFAGVLLVALAPLILSAMLVVKATSRGPAIYSQTRVGRGGREFTIYKLRSMSDDCESLTGPRWALPGDPRVTPVGHLLRALHIDELPQLWNVIRGDMSLIGPRPERPELCVEIRKHVDGYDRRHVVKPGITGFAQVHLPPDSTMRSVREKLVYDRFYILHRGPLLDVKIYVLTGLKVLGLTWLCWKQRSRSSVAKTSRPNQGP